MARKRSKRDMAYFLDIDVSTLYNWRKHKPNLYKIVMLGFAFDELISTQQRQLQELSAYREEIEGEIAPSRAEASGGGIEEEIL